MAPPPGLLACWPPGLGGVPPSYLLDVALDVERQVEEELEALQDVERVARGVGFVLPSQDLLEERVCGIARACRDG